MDTPNDLTVLGQLAVPSLLQLGGLAYMASTRVVGVALGRQLSLHERLTLQEALNVQTMEGIVLYVQGRLSPVILGASLFDMIFAVLFTVCFVATAKQA